MVVGNFWNDDNRERFVRLRKIKYTEIEIGKSQKKLHSSVVDYDLYSLRQI